MTKRYENAHNIGTDENLVCIQLLDQFVIGKEIFEIVLYGIYVDKTEDCPEIGETYYSCFMNFEEKTSYFKEKIDCYKFAIDRYNSSLIK